MEYFEAHPAAGLVPMATAEEQKALTEDIKLNGQEEDIMLYRGKIIDGRCRQLACKELGIQVKSIALPNNMSLEDVHALVKSRNIRRNLNRTQKVISAYRESINRKISLAKAARSWGLTKAELSQIKYIEENKPLWVQILFNGDKVEYIDGDSGKVKLGLGIRGIEKSIRAENERTMGEKSYANENSVHFAKMVSRIELLCSQMSEDFKPQSRTIHAALQTVMGHYK